MKRTYFLFCCLTVLFIFYFISCRKQDTVNQPNTNFTVAEAQDWFGKNVLSQKKINNVGELRNTHHARNKTPYWPGAKTYKIGTDRIMEIPFQSKSLEGFQINAPAHSTITNLANIPGLQELIITKHANDSIDYGIMTLIPDSAYRQIHGNDLTNNHYRNFSKNFSGLVLYHNWNGDFLNGWGFTNGKITGEIGSETIVDTNAAYLLAPPPDQCYTVTITDWEVDCTDTYIGGVYASSDCGEPYITNQYSYPVCTSSGGGSGGGGGYETITDTTHTANNSDPLDSLTNSINLTTQEKILLDSALQQVLQNCINRAYINYLENNGQKFNFSMDLSQASEANFNPATMSITFRDNNAIQNSDALREELFHAYQNAFYPGGTQQYLTNGEVNIEFEAKLMRDIDLVTRGLPCCMTVNTSSSINNDYIKWINLITSDGKSYPTNFDDIKDQYFYFMQQFALTFDSSYTGNIDPNLEPNALFNLYSTSGCSTTYDGIIVTP